MNLQALAVALVRAGVPAIYVHDHAPYIELPDAHALLGEGDEPDTLTIETYRPGTAFVEGDVLAHVSTSTTRPKREDELAEWVRGVLA